MRKILLMIIGILHALDDTEIPSFGKRVKILEVIARHVFFFLTSNIII
jgi:hypothetical protein